MANVTVRGLDLKGLKNHLKDLIGDKKPGVKVGIMEGETYPDGTSVAYVASIHEFGATWTQPARETTLYFKQNADGSVGNRFVSKDKSNFSQTANIDSHQIIIPPRPFMRNTVENKKGEWIDLAAKYLKGAIDKHGIEQAFTGVGQKMAEDMKDYLESGEVQPGLADATVAEKNRLGYTEHASKPLIRTGDLMANITPQFVEDITKV